MISTTLAVAAAAVLSGNAPVPGPPRIVATLPHIRAQQVDVSPDGQQVYVAVGVQRGEIIDATTGEIRDVSEPAWASEYWRWKSGRANPAKPTELISLVFHRVENVTANPLPATTDLSVSDSDAYSPLHPTQKTVQSVINLELRRAVIGSFSGAIVHGLTFGWAPGPLGWIAYRDASGRLALMNPSGRTFVAPKTRNVWLPAWAPDGTRIFYVEQQGDAVRIDEIRVNTAER